MKLLFLIAPTFILSFAEKVEAQPVDASAPVVVPSSQCSSAAACISECRQQNGDACFRAYDTLKDVDGKVVEALTALDSACALNQPLGCIELAKFMRAGITNAAGTVILRRDPPRAATIQRQGIALLSSGCENGIVHYCGILGDYYDSGNQAAGIQKDQAKANELFLKACDGHDGYGCYSVGFNLKSGNGGPTDEAKAKEFFKKACGAGNGAGCAEIGENEKACKLGVEASCDVLCNAGNWTACSGGGPESQAKAARKKAESEIAGLFARCADNKHKIEKLRITGIQAARSGNVKNAEEATQKMKGLEPQWSDTLDMIHRDIDLLTLNESGDRDRVKYAVLLRRVRNECSCEPTRAGKCR